MEMGVWAGREADRMSRVRWVAHEKAWLAKRVYETFSSQGFNPLKSNRRIVEKEMMGPLREAVEQMPPDRRREIAGPVHVPWLADMVEEQFRKNSPKSEKVETIPLMKQSIPFQPEAEYLQVDNIVLPDGYVIVPDSVLYELQRFTNRNHRRLIALDDKLDTLIDLILDAYPKALNRENPSPPQTQLPEYEIPIVVIASVDEREKERIESATSNLAIEIIFIDARMRRPETIGECDWLIITARTGKAWKKAARKVFTEKFSVVNGASEIISTIHSVLGRKP